jgi:hypothetical protein
MLHRYLAPVVAVTLGCASSPNAKRGAASLWPAGNDPQWRVFKGVTYTQQGSIRVVASAPVYAVFLELRPKLDSLDVRSGIDIGGAIPVGVSDFATSMETVDALQGATANAQFTNCTTMKSAGDETGQQFCPVSRSYGPEASRQWRYRNRVFLLISDRPFTRPLPQAIQWSSRSTSPPVSPGAKWRALEL